jgi:outer membrane protein assembly factor BamB
MQIPKPLVRFIAAAAIAMLAACDLSPAPPPQPGTPTPSAPLPSVTAQSVRPSPPQGTATPRPRPTQQAEISLPTPDPKQPVRAWDYPVEGVIMGGVGASDTAAFFSVQHGEIFALDAVTGRELWKTSLPANITSTPVVSGTSLYLTVFLVQPQIGALIALDTRTGTELWSYEGQGESVSSPAIARDLVVFADSSGNLQALDASTGEEQWIYPMPNLLSSTPLYDDGKLYLSDYGGSLTALDAEKGELLWSLPTPRENRYDPAAILGPAIGGDLAFYARQDMATLYAVDRRTGRERWNFNATPLGTPVSILSPGSRYGVLATSAPAVVGDMVVVGISFGEIGGPAPDRYGFIYALDVKTGAVRWRREVANEIYSQPVVHRGALIFAAKHGVVYALDPRTGAQVWSFEADGPMHNSIVPRANNLLFGTWAGTFYGLRWP